MAPPALILLTILLTVTPTPVHPLCYNPTPPYPPPVLRHSDRAVRSLFDSIQRDLVGLPDSEIPSRHVSFSVEVTSAEETLWGWYHAADDPPGSNDEHVAGRDRNASSVRMTGGRDEHRELEQDDQQHILAGSGPQHPRVGDHTPITSTVDEHSMYRLASVSKLFTVLAVLQAHEKGLLDLDKPITEYVPELRRPSPVGASGTQWEKITLRALGSQLSGIRRESAKMTPVWDLRSEMNPQIDPVSLGYPALGPGDTPSCGDLLKGFECSRKELLEEAISQRPVYQPMFKSSYSNLAFVLLGMAVENVTAMPYNDVIQKWIFDPLNMTDASGDKPNDSRGAIVGDGGDWGRDFGYYNATGGLYSSTHSMSRFLRHILTTPSLRNTWLHPASFTPGISSSYGMPWEIYHSRLFLPAHAHRPTTFYSKAGDVGGYHSFILLLPQQNIGISILTAGPGLAPVRAKYSIREALTRRLVPGIEDIALAQMQQRYAGHYAYRPRDSRDRKSNKNKALLDSSLTLAVSPTRGLHVSRWTSNGTDFLAHFGNLHMRPGGVPPHRGGRWHAQVIPSMLFEEAASGLDDFAPDYGGDGDGDVDLEYDERSRLQRKRKRGTSAANEIWRVKYAPEEAPDDADAGDDPLWEAFCFDDVQGFLYGGLDVNELVFEMGGDSRASAVTVRGLRVRLERVMGADDGARLGSGVDGVAATAAADAKDGRREEYEEVQGGSLPKVGEDQEGKGTAVYSFSSSSSLREKWEVVVRVLQRGYRAALCGE